MNAAAAQTPPPVQRGAYTISISNRAFGAPLFGNSSTTNFSFFGHQPLPGGVDLSAFAYGGFPSTTMYFGLDADRVAFLNGFARVSAGDLVVSRLQPEGFASVYGDTFPLEGLQVRWRNGNDAFAVFGGVSKYTLSLPEQPQRRPILAGAEYMTRFDRNYLSAAMIVIDHPVYAAPDIHRDDDAIARASLMREVSPTAFVFADAYGGRGKGLRLGAMANFRVGQASLSAYHYDRSLPLISLFNPGDSGVEASGFYRPTELSTLSAQLFFVASDANSRRRELRGQAGYGYSFGSGAPYIFISYGHEQLSSIDEDISSLGDRLAISATRASLAGYSSLSLEHLSYRAGFSPDRTQLIAIDQRVVHVDAFLDSELVVQTEPNRRGATLESAMNFPWRGPYYFLFGAGVGFLSTDIDRGEGILRLGVSRRPSLNGIYGRTEARIPFSVGLPRSRFNRSAVTLDIGARFGWEELKNIRTSLAPILSPNQFGTIAGRVTLGGEGVGAIPIFVNGQRAATTDASGEFRTSRVPVGAANVSVDSTNFEPGVAIAGESSFDITVQPRQVSRVEFKLGRFSTLRGSLVLCVGDRPRAIPGARLSLISGATAFPLDVSASGGFQADTIPPGRYDIVIDPASVPGVQPQDLPRLAVDLTHDVLGYVIGIKCPEVVIARPAQPAPVEQPAPAVVEPAPMLAPAPVPAPAPAPAPAPVSGGLDRAIALVRDGDFAGALELFERLGPVTDANARYYYAVALYERGRYADAKREIAAASVPDTTEAARYVAKIAGAILPDGN